MDKPARLSWRVQNVSNDVADLEIYGVIGDPWDGTTASEFNSALRSLKASRVNFLFNSPGGFVSDGLAMYNAILGHKAEKVGYVEGSADSAASFVFQAMDKRVIAKNASMFIHRAQGLALGDEDDAMALHEMLKEASANIASIYADRAGGTVEDWLTAMGAQPARGTLYRGQAAVDAGLADEVGIYVQNIATSRIAAQVSPEPEAPVELDPSLFTPSATSYEKPLPKDYTRLFEKHLRKETSNV
jgi:ATP-dependent protease ClpP protease subunit